MTPAEFSALVKSIKLGLHGKIQAELVVGVSNPADRMPKVIPRIISDRNAKRWAAQLVSERHTVDGVKQVHAFMLGYGGGEQLKATTINSVDYRLRWIFTAYYQEYAGTDADNAEDRLADEVDRAKHVLVGAHSLGISKMKRIHSFRERRSMERIGVIVVKASHGEFFTDLESLVKF